jgi:hypothetical protein
LVARDTSYLVRGRRKLDSECIIRLQFAGDIYRRERHCATELKPVSEIEK